MEDVKILGLVSLNNRRYKPDAIIKALEKYEGAFAYVDHGEPGSPRRFIDKFGRFSNVRFVEGDGLRGNFKFNRKHPMAETFIGWLESDPSAVGFSHNIYGMATTADDGVDEIEEILDVESVDLVDKPGSTKGIFENMDPTIHSPTPPPVPPAAVSAPDAAKPTLDSAIADLIASILNDPTLHPRDKRDKVLTALDLVSVDPTPVVKDKPGEKEPPDDGDDEEMTDDKAEERCRGMTSKAVKWLLNRLEEFRLGKRQTEKKDKAKQLCKQHGLTESHVSELFLGLLIESKDDLAMVKLIQDRLSVLSTKSPVAIVPTGDVKSLTVDDMVKAINEGK